MATVLPLNAQLTAFQVFLPVQGKEYEFGLHNVPSPEEAGKVSLRNAKLDCKLELRMLLEGFEHVLQERMKQSLDVATFVEEFKDILDRIVQAQPQVVLPPASFYARIVAEIEAIGWEHVAWISPQLTTLHLRFL
jgi:E3 ubiquitin-protein ligase FANCL